MVVLTEEDLREAGLEGSPCSFPRAVIDSREANPGDLFVCLKGESTDGHLFARDACARGATLVLCQRSEAGTVRDSLSGLEGISLLVSTDPLASLQAIGRIRRRQYRGSVLAVAGSNGKTSTKDMLASLLRSLYGADSVFATPGNWNNHLGVPLSLCALPDDARFAVLELGMNHPGEIELLAKMARPHHVLVPSIGYEHMEFFRNIEAVAEAELEVLTGMEEGGRIVYPAAAPLGDALIRESNRRFLCPIFFGLQTPLNAPLPRVGEVPVRIGIYHTVSATPGGIGSSVEYEGRPFSTGEYRGEGMASNLLACLVLLFEILPPYDAFPGGVSSQGDGPATGDLATTLMRAAGELKPLAKGRFRIERIESTTLVDDTYNANPDSFRQSLRSLREILPGGRLLCLAGHMAELGHFSREGHDAVGGYLAESGVGELLVCGSEDVRFMAARFSRERGGEIKYFDDSESLSNYIKANPVVVQGWDGILVKGSRSARMERVLPAIRQALAMT